jgi:hypothetical protein
VENSTGVLSSPDPQTKLFHGLLEPLELPEPELSLEELLPPMLLLLEPELEPPGVDEPPWPC